MKAAIAPAYGPPEVVRITELPTPEPKADEIRIRVRCATVNRTDCGFRSAEYGIIRLFALCDLHAAKLRAGQRILINGTTGAIGSAAVQLAKHMGAHVTAVCDTKNLDRVAALGADIVIDYLNEDIVARGGRYDIVFDAVGKRRYRDFVPVLDADGVFMSTELGPGAENVTLALKGWLFRSKKRVLFPIPSIDAAMVEYLGDLTASGAFTPVIDRSYALDDIVEAYRYVETGMKTGNVLLLP